MVELNPRTSIGFGEIKSFIHHWASVELSHPDENWKFIVQVDVNDVAGGGGMLCEKERMAVYILCPMHQENSQRETGQFGKRQFCCKVRPLYGVTGWRAPRFPLISGLVIKIWRCCIAPGFWGPNNYGGQNSSQSFNLLGITRQGKRTFWLMHCAGCLSMKANRRGNWFYVPVNSVGRDSGY